MQSFNKPVGVQFGRIFSLIFIDLDAITILSHATSWSQKYKILREESINFFSSPISPT